MNKVRFLLVSMLSLSCLLVGTQNTYAADASVGVDVASAYVFRGGELNDSWVAQPYVELSGFPKVEGLTVGAWGNFDIHDGRGGSPESGEFSEVDIYASYDLPLGLDKLGVSLGYIEYLYPNADASADREFNLVFSAEDCFLSPSLGAYFGVDGAIDEQVYIELGVGHDIAISDDINASLGGILAYVSQGEANEAADDGLSYGAVNLALSKGSWSIGATWYGETDDDVQEISKEVVGSVSWGMEF